MIEAVTAAGEAILRVYGQERIEATAKADESPVTVADHAAQRILADALATLAAEIPVLSEEGEHADAAERADWPVLWIVDPLDGTREFLARNDEFTVNVALVEDGRPTLGVVGVPAMGRVFAGRVEEGIAEQIDTATGERTRIRTRPCPREPVITASRSHRGPRMEALVAALRADFPGLSEERVGSALKLVELARGRCDGYPRRGPCSEWDIAAGEAVLCAAGGLVRRWDGEPLAYNKPEGLLNPDFWAVADPDGALAVWFRRHVEA
ncbi:MAG: 3'(2'),5'-bisphosphate nucleotidase CysQ [Gammaproteobacteria bacterium]|nr:3'(2'),5'-bisphosphate nucleotidase CysQ [Gammaproteobacteria bacterium]